MNSVVAPTIGSMTATSGTLLSGRYRLEEQIGRGGMSTVYRAFDTTLERPVAIKVMHREIAARQPTSSSASAARRGPSRSSPSPHVVGVIDAGEDGRTRPTSSSSTSRARR